MLPFHGVREIINELTQCSRIESCGCGGESCAYKISVLWKMWSLLCMGCGDRLNLFLNVSNQNCLWRFLLKFEFRIRDMIVGLMWCVVLCYVRKKCWWNQKLKKWCGRIGKLLAENWNVFFEFSMDKTKRESRKMHLNKFVN